MEFAHPLDGGRAAAVTRSAAGTAARSAVTRGSYRRLMQPLVAGGTAVTDLLLSAMRRPQGRYFPGLAVLARHRPAAPAGRGGSAPPGVRALVAGAAAHAAMPLNVPPAGGVVGLRRVSGAVSAGEQITYPGAARTASQTAGTCAPIGSARGRLRPLGDMQAEAEGDTEDMNRERAETHLRLLAEEELRRATAQPSDGTSGCQPDDEAVRSASVTGTLAGSAAVPDAFMASRRGRSAGRPAWRCPGERVQRMGRRARRGRGHRVSVTAWPGTPVTITVTPRPLGHAITRGQPVAQATVTIGGEVRHITLVAGRAAPAPSVRWRLTRL